MSYHIAKCGEVIPMAIRSTISSRYKTITKAVNREFWNSTSETAHSLYVGSYGRGTAIDTSDIDILLELPRSEYERYDYYRGNGQSRLLQAVKSAIQNSYPRTDVRADGQVVKLAFTDGLQIEVLPAFASTDWYGKTTYQYPDTNMGGNWRSTNPKAEQSAMKDKNTSSRGLLFDTCKHMCIPSTTSTGVTGVTAVSLTLAPRHRVRTALRSHKGRPAAEQSGSRRIMRSPSHTIPTAH